MIMRDGLLPIGSSETKTLEAKKSASPSDTSSACRPVARAIIDRMSSIHARRGVIGSAVVPTLIASILPAGQLAGRRPNAGPGAPWTAVEAERSDREAE